MTEQEYFDMYDVVGVALDVYNELGRGMEEPIYQEALAIEFRLRGMAVEREKVLSLSYKGIALEKKYKADFYYKGIVIELKSVEQVNSDHRAQLSTICESPIRSEACCLTTEKKAYTLNAIFIFQKTTNSCC